MHWAAAALLGYNNFQHPAVPGPLATTIFSILQSPGHWCQSALQASVPLAAAVNPVYLSLPLVAALKAEVLQAIGVNQNRAALHSRH